MSRYNKVIIYKRNWNIWIQVLSTVVTYLTLHLGPLPIYTPGVSEASEEGREHTSWNPKALNNWVICFRIHLDSCIITFFLSFWIIPISRQTCHSISHFSKCPFLAPVDFQFLSDFSASSQRKVQELIIRTVSTSSHPIFFPIRFYSHYVPWKNSFPSCCQIYCSVDSQSSSISPVIAKVGHTMLLAETPSSELHSPDLPLTFLLSPS